MAKRRRVSAPSSEEISKIEEEFRGETLRRPSGSMAPISQVVADTAAVAPVENPDVRAEQARDRKDAQALRNAQENGRVIAEIPLDEIEALAIVRDRTVLDPNEMQELKVSISMHGMRLPIEVFELSSSDGKRYGLISGYRRLSAMQGLREVHGGEKFTTIPALIRDPDALGGAVAAMVEENEVRSNLSHFERGRIAVIAAQQKMFPSTEAAVNALFASGSKAKRSKIRSFAVIFEELGDVLEFPENLTEKQGLRVANALRGGWDGQFRDAMTREEVLTPAHEWTLMEAVCAEYEANAIPNEKRGGRPKVMASKPARDSGETLHLSSGMSLQQQKDTGGYLIRVKGRGVNQEVIDDAVAYLAKYLDQF